MKKFISLSFCLLFLASIIQSQTVLNTVNNDFPVGSSTAWVVPPNVFSIVVNVTGAGGGDSRGVDGPSIGGLGASLGASFEVTPGHTLNIIVGEQGGIGGVVSFDTNVSGDGGGGGGTAIYNVTTSELLIAAGGGGGAHGDFATGMNVNGGDALAPSALIMPNGGAGNQGAGGGGSDNDGNPGEDGALGGVASNSGGNGGVGGTKNTNGGTGGFGYGGGGGAHQNSGGGGGGSFGGEGGVGGDGGVNRHGKGGGSHIAEAMALSFALAASPMDGSAQISFEVTPIPTMGQWGLTILAVFMLIIGTVVAKQRSLIFE